MNLECCFVVVWPQRQTFVRILKQNQNRPSAQSRRPTRATSHPCTVSSALSAYVAPAGLAPSVSSSLPTGIAFPRLATIRAG